MITVSSPKPTTKPTVTAQRAAGGTAAAAAPAPSTSTTRDTFQRGGATARAPEASTPSDTRGTVKAGALRGAVAAGADPMRAMTTARSSAASLDPRLASAAGRVSSLANAGDKLAGVTRPPEHGLDASALSLDAPTTPKPGDTARSGDKPGLLQDLLAGTPGGDPTAAQASFDPHKALTDRLGANQAAVGQATRDALSKMGLDPNLAGQRGMGGGAEPAPDLLGARPQPTSTGRGDRADPMSFANASEARRAQTSAEGSGGSGDGSGAGGGGAAKPGGGVLDTIKNVATAVACAILPEPVASAACGIALSTTSDEDARNTANGILGTARSGATGTSNAEAAKQLAELEKNKTPNPNDDGAGGTISAEQWNAKRNGAVCPADESPGIDLDAAAARIGQGNAIRIMSTVNPNPEADPHREAVVLPNNPLVDPVEPATPEGLGTPVVVPFRPEPVPGRGPR